MKNFLQKHALYFLVFTVSVIFVLIFILVKFVFFQKSEVKTESDILIDKVGEIVYLPIGETPSVATVTDPSKLKNQNFFENAKTGDKVLIYPKSGKAVLYDPEVHKIVNISSILLNASLENESNINQQEF
ncbi:MAG: hypothetical protein WC011_02555 [Candidatus Paceibacterota bacterium]